MAMVALVMEAGSALGASRGRKAVRGFILVKHLLKRETPWFKSTDLSGPQRR